ncbi:hypothetical protein AVEN_83101-1 [Araneus ventricosus]|uniref:Uncharacterized protein n=1 Tax=Araneus ventricosus TaxID=182803 RepID=A0A4Y2APS9_ARAVE|nr:hypothetical protein AVEN_83101-1 [Araneus ventricosus]
MFLSLLFGFFLSLPLPTTLSSELEIQEPVSYLPDLTFLTPLNLVAGDKCYASSCSKDLLPFSPDDLGSHPGVCTSPPVPFRRHQGLQKHLLPENWGFNRVADAEVLDRCRHPEQLFCLGEE